MLYTIAAVRLKKKLLEKPPFKSLSFPDFTNTSCDKNSLTNATDTELQIFRAVEP